MKPFSYFFEEVNRLIDRLKMPIDYNIKYCVAVLRYSGFYTAMSCHGHVKRGYNYPWVRFKDPHKTKEKLEPLLKRFSENKDCNLYFDGTDLRPIKITDLNSMRNDMNSFADFLLTLGGDPENENVSTTFDF